MKNEIVSLNFGKAELNNEMKLDERIERLSSAVQRQIHGGASCTCYSQCRCHYDCPRDGCVDCYCYGDDPECHEYGFCSCDFDDHCTTMT